PSLPGLTTAQRRANAVHPGTGDRPPTRTTISTITLDGPGSVPIGARYQAQVGRRLTGCPVTAITQDPEVRIFHGNVLIRELTIDPTRRYQPSGQPCGGRRQRRVLAAVQ